MASVPERKLTPQEYLTLERAAETKSDFYRGEMFAMSVASRRHNRVTLNTGASLWQQLKDRGCEVYTNDMRVKVDATGLYTYPDVAVVCGEGEFEDDHVDTLVNPKVLVETLSESTAAYDCGRKFAHYRQIPSLQEYVMISQDERRVEHYVRQPDGQWLFSEVTAADGVVHLPSIDCELRLADVYERVELAETA